MFVYSASPADYWSISRNQLKIYNEHKTWVAQHDRTLDLNVESDAELWHAINENRKLMYEAGVVSIVFAAFYVESEANKFLAAHAYKFSDARLHEIEKIKPYKKWEKILEATNASEAAWLDEKNHAMQAYRELASYRNDLVHADKTWHAPAVSEDEGVRLGAMRKIDLDPGAVAKEEDKKFHRITKSTGKTIKNLAKLIWRVDDSEVSFAFSALKPEV